ncbi:MAG TPA: hypothetical protein PLF84_16845 [Bryobacteraceae bacterium]|nr:hypothetical protein [Bryobacterales bacterium]HRJ20720.1 hypothetical protein [Bryobacteraceae bacterium]
MVKQRKGLAVAMLWTVVMPAAANGPQELEALHGAWSTALTEWKQTGVEEDRALFQKPVGEALAGIEDAAEKRRRLTEAKRRYLRALAGEYRAQAQRLQAAEQEKSEPASEMGLRLAMGSAIGEVERQVKSLGAADRESLPVLQRQRTELMAVRSSMEARQQARERSGAGRGPGAEVTAPAVESLMGLANRLDAQEGVLRAEAEAWDRVYEGLKVEVERRGPKTGSMTGTGAPATGAAVPVGMEAVATAQAVVPPLGGVWFLQNLDARKTDDGAYEPRFVNVRITQQDDLVQGSYEGVYAVPEDEPHNPTVRFSFEGRIRTETMRFALKAPLQGTILIQKVGAHQIRVSYAIDNPEARNISFGYVPDESPQTLQKKVD